MMSVTLRVYDGVASHFKARKSEWVLAICLIGWGLVLAQPGDTFGTSPAWSQMRDMWSEETWASVAIFVGTLRIISLLVNGTFPHTWYGQYSPHARAATSFLTCGVWFQILFGLSGSEVISTAYPVYLSLFVLDVMNVMAAMEDAAYVKKNATVKRITANGHVGGIRI